MKRIAPVVAALALSAASVSAFALTTGDLYGEPASEGYTADRTVVVTPQTKYVNVARGETVKFKVGSQEFTWDFNGVAHPFYLAKIAPEGALDHRVQVYVSSSMQDGGFGD